MAEHFYYDRNRLREPPKRSAHGFGQNTAQKTRAANLNIVPYKDGWCVTCLFLFRNSRVIYLGTPGAALPRPLRQAREHQGWHGLVYTQGHDHHQALHPDASSWCSETPPCPSVSLIGRRFRPGWRAGGYQRRNILSSAAARGSTSRRTGGPISRDSLLWTAHELAAKRHGRLGWSTSPPGEYRPVPSFDPVIEGDKGKGVFSMAGFDVSAPRNDGPERFPQKTRHAASPLSN